MNRLILAATMAGLITSPLTAEIDEPTGGGSVERPNRACLTDSERDDIQFELRGSRARLKAEGRLPAPEFRRGGSSFAWPVQGSAVVDDPAVDAISNYVDHDEATGPLLDFNCGSRTYDTASGYDHQGIDIYTWPFWWYKMDHDLAEVVAVADGTIIHKADGNFDRSCDFGGDWNAVYVDNNDGTTVWYGHLKSGSLTSKNIGETINEGDFVGVIGSSGSSTGPHLHLETYDASNNLLDPFMGPCNSLNPSSLWASQEPYYASRVNALMTHSAPPVFPPCPQTEVLNDQNTFDAGDTVFLAAYYRDQLRDQLTAFDVIMPNGITRWSWSHALTSADHYSNAFWYWTRTLDDDALGGTWTFRTTFQGEVTNYPFTVTGEVPVEATTWSDLKLVFR